MLAVIFIYICKEVNMLVTIIYIVLILVDVMAVGIYTFILCDMIKDYKRRKKKHGKNR